MSEFLQPGLHPDPDSLSAFAEGVLPEHERAQCMAHLAECAACREVVFLVQESLPVEELPAPATPEKVSFWKRWLTPLPALSAAMVAGILVLSVWVYQQRRPAVSSPPPELIAVAPAPERAVPIVPELLSRAAPRTAAKAVPTRADNAPVAPPPPLVALDAAAPVAPPPAPVPDPQGAIAGTITDPAGAAIAGATVRVRPVTGPSAGLSFRSDQAGQFKAAGLEPGAYELQMGATGFKSLTKQVELQPQQIARADSTLSVGSVSESIEVTAAVAAVAPAVAAPMPLPERGGGRGGRGGGGGGAGLAGAKAPPPTPALDGVAATFATKLSADQTVTNGKWTLRKDSGGALSISENAGKKWKAVKPVWKGKAMNLIALPVAPSSSDPFFQLTTDTGAIWLSRDGSHWYDSQKK